jgi:hypothetical protein
MAAYRRLFFYEINLKARVTKIQGGLNAADASTDNHYVAKLPIAEGYAPLCLLLLRSQFSFHFHSLIRHYVLRLFGVGELNPGFRRNDVRKDRLA